ncbi:hypothetical protein AB0A69_00670 [Streptomyces sp. NPDC045431]|uniref:hypothetical protein n=1 Tax=Streptomyces sp. NPDC045431 TaxID=3155613 RepID=UPI003409B42C
MPQRIDELSRTYQVSDSGRVGLEIPAEAYASGTVSIQDVASNLIRPLHCTAMYKEPGPGQKYWEREFSLYFTLMHAAGIKVDPAEFPVQPRLLTPAETEKIMNDYADCELEGA